MSSEPCSFCGKDHPPTILETLGLPVRSCPRLPPGAIYVDVEYATGPRGMLITMPQNSGNPAWLRRGFEGVDK